MVTPPTLVPSGAPNPPPIASPSISINVSSLTRKSSANATPSNSRSSSRSNMKPGRVILFSLSSVIRNPASLPNESRMSCTCGGALAMIDSPPSISPNTASAQSMTRFTSRSLCASGLPCCPEPVRVPPACAVARRTCPRSGHCPCPVDGARTSCCARGPPRTRGCSCRRR